MSTRNHKVSNKRAPDVYLKWIRRFPLRPLRSEEELNKAIAVLDSLLDRETLDPAEEDYLEVLGDLVERFETEHHPIEDVGEGEVLRFLLDQREVTQAQVARSTGIAESTISEVLSGKRILTRSHLIKLAHFFNVSPAVFLPFAQVGTN